MHLSLLLTGLVLALPSWATNSTYNNPMLPGWHSDPSCIYVADDYDAFFCATSTFSLFPGIPIFASKDLMQWRLASHAFSRQEQVPQLVNTTSQIGGIWAANIRYRKGIFYVVTIYTPKVPFTLTGLIFTTTNPFDSAAWSQPLSFPLKNIDPDLFWDTDGVAYLTTAGIHQQTINLTTGALSKSTVTWLGSGGRYVEGPHIYLKDNTYYLMVAEGGSAINHMVTIAQSPNVTGPYTGYTSNPILTNAKTTEYFQTVGHADLFQDRSGNWWGVALATRSGAAYLNYPMGRETVLFAVTWAPGQWPILEPVRGEMSGWALPAPSRDIDGIGPYLEDPDMEDFETGTAIPPQFAYWRFPPAGAFTVSPPGHPGTLRILPSAQSLSPANSSDLVNPLSLIMRVQTDTRFTYTVDVDFHPTVYEEEAGVTIFNTQSQHIDLGIVMLPANSSTGVLTPQFRLRVTGSGNGPKTSPIVTMPVPQSWLARAIQLKIQAVNETHYGFFASSIKSRKRVLTLGYALGTILSSGDGKFTGALVGAYATANGGVGTTEAYISRWRYRGNGQAIDNGTYVHTTP